MTKSALSPLRQKMLTVIRVRDLSSKTEESYLHVIEQLAAFYHRSPAELSRDEVIGFLEDCVTNRKLSRSTVNVYFCACRFLYQQVLKREPLSFKLPCRGRPRNRPQILSPEECLRIINGPVNLKHRAFLYMVYGSGLRVSEAVHLLPKHIESDRMMVFVKSGKGKKDRYTLLAQAALEVLREYWWAYRPVFWLFPGSDPRKPMSTNCGAQVYNQAVRASKVRRVGGIHALRHCFATHHIENGMDICTLQRLLGHSSILTTIRYMHVRQERQNQIISPLDRLNPA